MLDNVCFYQKVVRRPSDHFLVKIAQNTRNQRFIKA